MQLKKILLSLTALAVIAVILYNFAAHDPYEYNPSTEQPADNVPKANIEKLDPTEQAPELMFLNTNRDLKTLFGFKNKVLVVNFWASWCLPCLKEMPKLNNLKVKYAKDIEVITISIDSSSFDEVKQFFDQMNLKSLKFYMDHNNLSYIASRSLGIPTTIIIDSNYQIHYRITGYLDWTLPENEKLIEDLI